MSYELLNISYIASSFLNPGSTVCPMFNLIFQVYMRLVVLDSFQEWLQFPYHIRTYALLLFLLALWQRVSASGCETLVTWATSLPKSAQLRQEPFLSWSVTILIVYYSVDPVIHFFNFPLNSVTSSMQLRATHTTQQNVATLWTKQLCRELLPELNKCTKLGSTWAKTP